MRGLITTTFPLLRRLNDNGTVLVAAYGLALYGLFGHFHFSVNREFWERLMDSTHVPLFFALAAVTVNAPVFPKRMGRCWRAVAAALFLIVFDGAVEVIQPHFGRSESMTDFLNGVFGVSMGLAGVELWRRQPIRGLHLTYLVVVMLGCAISLRPVYGELRGILWMRLHFPELAGFESPWEMLEWHPTDGAKIEPSQLNTTDGKGALRVLFQDGTYPGVEFFCGELDWRRFATLEFDAYNPSAPFPLVLRVDDDGPHQAIGDRAHRTVMLGTGRNHITIPLKELERAPKNRTLNLGAIRRLVFFVEAQGERRALFLDSIRLTESRPF